MRMPACALGDDLSLVAPASEFGHLTQPEAKLLRHHHTLSVPGFSRGFEPVVPIREMLVDHACTNIRITEVRP